MVGLALLLPASAMAGFVGSPLTIEWHFPALGHIFASTTIVVGAGIEFPGQALGPAIDIGGDSIDFIDAAGDRFVERAFNGFVFSDSAGLLPPFRAVNIVEQVGYAGFAATDIGVNGDQIRIDLGRAVSIRGPLNRLRLAVLFGVPAPGTLSLTALALFALSWRRRQSQRCGRRPNITVSR